MVSQAAGRPLAARMLAHASRAIALASLLGGSLIIVAPAVPAVLAADPLTITTPFPSVAVQPGDTVSFPITVTADTTRLVDLTVSGTPNGGAARLTGGGFTVDSVTAALPTAGTSSTSGTPVAVGNVTLDVTLPTNATGTITMSVHAQSGSYSADLPLKMRIEGGAGGTITIDQPTGQKVAAGGNLTYNLTLHNNTPRDTTFTFGTQQPTGWQVQAQPGGSSQATSLKVTAGSTGSVTVIVAPVATAAAGDYKVEVDTATDGNLQPDPVLLPVTITGSYSLTLAPTTDENLATKAQAGSAQQYTWVITNTGSGVLTGVTIAATPPAGWTAAFDNPKIDQIAPGKTQNVTLTLTPASNAVAGDYNLTFNVNSTASGTAPAASDTQTLRVTVAVGLNWIVVGGAIIALVLIGLSWLFGRLGRR